MQIPVSFFGSWRGEVEDKKRVNPYPGEFCIEAEKVTGFYEMRQGDVRSQFTILSVSESLVLLEEKASNSFKGTVQLSFNRDGLLKCLWRNRKNEEVCSALMARFM